MCTVNLTDAKARLPYYVARAAHGEEIVILRERASLWPDWWAWSPRENAARWAWVRDGFTFRRISTPWPVLKSSSYSKALRSDC